MICCKSNRRRKTDLSVLNIQIYQKSFFRRAYTLILYPKYFEIVDVCIFSQVKKIKVDLELYSSIGLVYDKEQIVGISIKIKDRIELFYGANNQLRKFLEYIDCRLCLRQVTKHYQPTQHIGKGSSSEVFIVKELCSNQEYAAKSILKSYLMQHPKGMTAFEQEVLILRIFSKNPLFLKLHTIYESNTSYYIIQEYVRGLTLEQSLILKKEQQSRFTAEEILEICKQLLLIVKTMHSYNIMHRDLKPANIMFQSPNSLKLKIIDFGLAQNVEEEMIFKRCGTAGYVAPEVFRRNQYNQQCDVFSLGCIFYKLITGKTLYKGKSTEEILRENRKGNYNLEEIPEIAREFLEGMLRSDPAQRLTAEECYNHSFLGGDFTGRENFDDIEERSTYVKAGDSYQPQLSLKKMKSQKTIQTLSSMKSLKSFYVKKSMNGVQKMKA